ncbi:MAG: GspH/FimT family pseudopilin [Pseudomonadota bacterium]
MKNGFTIIELMLAVMVISIVAAIGIPGFQETIRNNRLASQTNSLIGTLNFARSEAAKLGNTTVTICGSSNQTACNTTNWESGWIIFRDADADGAVDTGEPILRVQEALSGGNTLRTSGFPNLARIQFGNRGNISQQGSLVLCDSRGNTFAHAIVLNLSGQSRSATDDDTTADSIVNIHSGGNATCP